eukprot:TRINITY_DN3840_c1_g1_i1.p1 TRINITY_DN3840_c1_g1~~TRINITY_DN3840_c1_g1_i1.p1  ORF type:complete len:179 (-),score=33.60 TRINITY_DN3840_c1_g1_i1:604-1086(-)
MAASRSKWVEYGGKTDRYTWDQQEDEVTVWVTFPERPELKSKDVEVKISGLKISIGLKGEKPKVEGELHAKVRSDWNWTIQEKNKIELVMEKLEKGEKAWWACFLKGDPIIDVEHIEKSKYFDEGMLEKIWEAKKKKKAEDAAAAGSAPTTEEKPAEAKP